MNEFRQKNPRAKIPETAFPEPYVLSKAEDKIIDDLLAILNTNQLNSQQSLELLERVGRIVEMGEQIARKTSH